MHLDTLDRATFASDAGASPVFNRQKGGEAHASSCEGGLEDWEQTDTGFPRAVKEMLCS